MPAPRRINRVVLILTPTYGKDLRDVIRLARMGTRAAIDQGLDPISPVLLYGPCLTLEELGQRLFKLTLDWYRRASRIWLCTEEDEGEIPRLDATTYRVILENEGGFMGYPKRNAYAAARIPVDRFDPYAPAQRSTTLMKREDLRAVLECSLTTGLPLG